MSTPPLSAFGWHVPHKDTSIQKTATKTDAANQKCSTVNVILFFLVTLTKELGVGADDDGYDDVHSYLRRCEDFRDVDGIGGGCEEEEDGDGGGVEGIDDEMTVMTWLFEYLTS
ncbi:hypothetical protein ElyMa_005836100 [Elysia marginata]|uniref:Uncharacterized protein n=1 Tax=Elysia marginata TaxID=1093978 RepID=A0AAV4FWS3_9GAST|nr:hypothetical protein ElyMa_005836100 [Elysia marginata]